MSGVASISLVINATVRYLLVVYREHEVEVIANLAVIFSGAIIRLTHFVLLVIERGARITTTTLHLQRRTFY